MSLKELLKGEKTLQSVKIKVISSHDEKSIVGDNTSLAICYNTNSEFQNMKPGQCYQILKPSVRGENEFVPNEKLKPIKVNNFEVKHNKQELAKLQAMMNPKNETKAMSRDKNNQLTSFKDIHGMPPHIEVKKITAKLVTLSKDIHGSYGTYWIGKLKDINCDIMDINIYNIKLKSKMAVGDVLDLKRLKSTVFVKDGKSFKRLATTSQSTVDKCNSDTEDLFKDVPIGDRREKCKVVAIHDIFPYMSCPNCWKKINEQDSSCSCENTMDTPVNDFHCQFYLESLKDEFIEVVHTFRRQTNLNPDTLVHNDVQTLLENTFLHKTFTFEWNILDGNEENLRMIKIENPNKQKKEGENSAAC